MQDALPPEPRSPATEANAPQRPRSWSAAQRRWQPLLCARIALVSGTRVLLYACVAALLVVSLLFVTLRFIDPPMSALMLSQSLGGNPIEQRWVPIARVTPHLVRAVILSEDNKFCSHFGLDLGEINAALAKAEREGEEALRGASTISQQVVKNLVLWPSRSTLRKVLEIGMTLPMEQILSKSRIMELYLNIAEWGPGIFGAEAASQFHFNKPAARLTVREAALLAVALPNPFDRVAGNPGQGTRRLASIIEDRMAAAGPTQARFGCVLK